MIIILRFPKAPRLKHGILLLHGGCSGAGPSLRQGRSSALLRRGLRFVPKLPQMKYRSWHKARACTRHQSLDRCAPTGEGILEMHAGRDFV